MKKSFDPHVALAEKQRALLRTLLTEASKGRASAVSYHSHNLDPVPTMPVVTPASAHRPKIPTDMPTVHALIARPVVKAEIKREPEAQKALDKEWSRLEEIKCWLCETGREWSGKGGVADEARRNGKKAHVGRLFEPCHEKGSEVPKGSKGRTYKRPTVFNGSDVRDESWGTAISSCISSSPPSMEAS